MAADAKLALLPKETPRRRPRDATRHKAPERPAVTRPRQPREGVAVAAPAVGALALFALLPLALIAGTYWYVSGGQVIDRRRLCRGRQGRHFHRRLRHRQGDRRQHNQNVTAGQAVPHGRSSVSARF